MSKALKYTFLVHAIVGLLTGLPLLIVPGRFLQILQWAPIDPIAARVLGAALLALSWSSFRGWQVTERRQVDIVVQLEAVFCVLASVALLRHLLVARFPIVPWLFFAVFFLFAIAWIYHLVRRAD